MLSPLLEEWRLTYLENHAKWFELARETNRCAVWLHQEHFEAGNGGPANDQAPTAVRIYSRALNGFAATVTLAERALAIEAAGAVRPIYEAGFWLSYLATEPLKALEELAVDEDHHAIRREKLLREKFPGDRAQVSASEARQARREPPVLASAVLLAWSLWPRRWGRTRAISSIGLSATSTATCRTTASMP